MTIESRLDSLLRIWTTAKLRRILRESQSRSLKNRVYTELLRRQRKVVQHVRVDHQRTTIDHAAMALHQSMQQPARSMPRLVQPSVPRGWDRV